MATKEQFEAAAKAAGWRYSPAHDGWIHDDERTGYREGMASYEPQPSAEDACWLHGIKIAGE